MDLRGASPDLWQRFIVAVAEYSVGMQGEMVRAAPELLMRAQGMALAANEIAGILANAPKLQDEFMAAQMRQQTRR